MRKIYFLKEKYWMCILLFQKYGNKLLTSNEVQFHIYMYLWNVYSQRVYLIGFQLARLDISILFQCISRNTIHSVLFPFRNELISTIVCFSCANWNFVNLFWWLIFTFLNVPKWLVRFCKPWFSQSLWRCIYLCVLKVRIPHWAALYNQVKQIWARGW